MHFVASFNKASTFNDLVEMKIFPKGRTLPHLLFLNGHLHLLKEYLSCVPFDPASFTSHLDEESSTPLILAIKNKHSSFMESLLRSQSFSQYTFDLRQTTSKYGPYLHLALKNHDFNLLSQHLLRSSRCLIDLAEVDEAEGNNLMHVLMGSHFGQGGRQSAVIAMQIIKQAKKAGITVGDIINGLNKAQLSPIHLAIKRFQNKSLKFALDFNLHQLKKNKQ
jgi:hypothetical protein